MHEIINHLNHKEVCDKFANAVEYVFGKKVSIQPIKKPSSFTKGEISQYRVRIVSSEITRRTMKMLHIPYNTVGNGSKTTLFHLPVIVTRNRDCWQGFLEGYLDTDGHRFRKDGYQSYDRLASTNEDFIKEMRQFLGQKVSSNCKCMKSLII